MGEWVDLDLNKKLFKNVDEASLTATYAALENCFVTEASGLSRFPGLKIFCDLGGKAEQHMNKYNNNMIAVGTDGRTHRIDIEGNAESVPGPSVLGGDRVSFARSRNGLFMAAGRQIIKYNGVQNSVLSPDAPLSNFIGYIDGYLLAVEKGSGRFQYSEPNDFSNWPALDTFGVDEAPDDIGSMIITPFNEILFGGEESVEQYERYPGGSVPFFRRWGIGDGISEPWTLCYADNATWGLNSQFEFARLSGQTSQSVSDDVQKEIEFRYSMRNLSSLKKAWAQHFNTKGQKFIVFQSPEATNRYGTKGVTFVLDIRRGQMFEIYGWDEVNGVPDLWPGRSVFGLWGKIFIGGEGKIYELDPLTFTNNLKTQRVFVRTAHFDNLGPVSISRVRMTLKRGVGSYTQNPQIWFRSNPDNKGFGLMQKADLGLKGEPEFGIEFGSQGLADTWQFEWGLTDACEFEMRRLQVEVSSLER